MTQDEMKQAVARAAIDYVEVGTIIGVGTGSTANFFIDELAKIKGKIEGTVASSIASAERLKGHGIPVYDLNAVDGLSVYVDGADESNRQLHLVKGGGDDSRRHHGGGPGGNRPRIQWDLHDCGQDRPFQEHHRARG